MAVQATTQILHDGVTNVVMRFTGIFDGDGQETNAIKVDVSALNPPCEAVKILKGSYDVYGGLLTISWAADANVEFMRLSSASTFDFCSTGGLNNGADNTASGDILFSTTGMGPGDSYDVTLEMKKKGVPN